MGKKTYNFLAAMAGDGASWVPWPGTTKKEQYGRR
jgi:hypothetical protein